MMKNISINTNELSYTDSGLIHIPHVWNESRLRPDISYCIVALKGLKYFIFITLG